MIHLLLIKRTIPLFNREMKRNFFVGEIKFLDSIKKTNFIISPESRWLLDENRWIELKNTMYAHMQMLTNMKHFNEILITILQTHEWASIIRVVCDSSLLLLLSIPSLCSSHVLTANGVDGIALVSNIYFRRIIQ